MKLTVSQEEYLKTIYLLEYVNNKIRVTDIAKKMNITKPSVNKAINVLKEMELINYEIYGNITLTPKAKKIAKEILKKQDLVEMFLVGFLEVEEEQAKQDASLMKSSISKETEEKLCKYIIDLLEYRNIGCKCNYQEGEDKCKKCTNTKIRNKLKDNKEWSKSLDYGRK